MILSFRPTLLPATPSNGAIAAHVIDTHRVDRIATRIEIPEQETTVVLTALRSVIQACAAPAVFATVSSEMRSAAEFSVTSITGILRLLAAAPDVVALAGDLIVDFIEAGDSTAYGLMNAVTAAAKHMQSPERRWQLESIGGGIPARALDLSLAHTGDSALGA